MAFSLLWEVFQYSVVKHNELTKGEFRVSRSYTSTIYKLSLSLFPVRVQWKKKSRHFHDENKVLLRGASLSHVYHPLQQQLQP